MWIFNEAEFWKKWISVRLILYSRSGESVTFQILLDSSPSQHGPLSGMMKFVVLLEWLQGMRIGDTVFQSESKELHWESAFQLTGCRTVGFCRELSYLQRYLISTWSRLEFLLITLSSISLQHLKEERLCNPWTVAWLQCEMGEEIQAELESWLDGGSVVE